MLLLYNVLFGLFTSQTQTFGHCIVQLVTQGPTIPDQAGNFFYGIYFSL